MLRLVVGNVGLENGREQLAEHSHIEKPRHFLADTLDAEVRFRPFATRAKTAQCELPLGIERVIEIEHDAQAAHRRTPVQGCSSAVRTHHNHHTSARNDNNLRERTPLST